MNLNHSFVGFCMRKKRDTKVSDIMTRNVVCVDSDATLEDAMKILARREIRGMPVVEGKRVVGMIHEGDVIKYIMKHTKNLKTKNLNEKIKELYSKKVSVAMRKKFTSVSPDTPLNELAKIFMETGESRFPVVKNGKLVGIVSRDDLVRALSKISARYEASKVGLETDVDRLISLVEEKGRVSSSTASKFLGVEKEKVEEMAKILNGHGLIDIEYGIKGLVMKKKKSK